MTIINIVCDVCGALWDSRFNGMSISRVTEDAKGLETITYMSPPLWYELKLPKGKVEHYCNKECLAKAIKEIC